MTDLISRAAAIDAVTRELDFLGSRETNAAVRVLERLPAVDTGAHWVRHETGLRGYYECSACGRTSRDATEYCGRCGVRLGEDSWQGYPVEPA